MKQSTLIISVVIGLAMLVIIWRVAFYTSKAGPQQDDINTKGETEVKTDIKPKIVQKVEKQDDANEIETKQAEVVTPVRTHEDTKLQILPPAERAKLIQRWDNMSDQEKLESLAKMSARTERWENMSDQEKKEYIENIRKSVETQQQIND